MQHLFLDDEAIELQEGLRRRWHRPEKRDQPVLEPEGPLEGRRLHIWNAPLPKDGGGWRMWYIGGEGLNPLYADSEDGLRWRRPSAGPVESANLVDLGFDAERKALRIVLTRNPAGEGGDRRYCGLTRVGGVVKPLFSADGLRWRFMADHPGVPSDDEYRLGADPAGGRLIATVKAVGFKGHARFSVPEYGRAVAVSTSGDGLDWTEPEIVFHSDERDRAAGAEMVERHLTDPGLCSPLYADPAHPWTDVYNMPVFACEGVCLALPVMFHQSGPWQNPANPNAANQDGLLCPYLAWSRDLRRWERPAERVPLIPLSPCGDQRVYDNGAIHACAPVRRDSEMWFYYYGARHTHIKMELAERSGRYPPDLPMGAVFVAKLRLNGFASLRAGQERGFALTKPVTVDGPALRVNASAVGGEVRAEIRDAETGRAIPGFCMGDRLAGRTFHFPDRTVHPRRGGPGARFADDPVEDDSVPFSGDSVEALMTWRGGSALDDLLGRKVRLFFALRNADLYSFGFDPA